MKWYVYISNIFTYMLYYFLFRVFQNAHLVDVVQKHQAITGVPSLSQFRLGTPSSIGSSTSNLVQIPSPSIYTLSHNDVLDNEGAV